MDHFQGKRRRSEKKEPNENEIFQTKKHNQFSTDPNMTPETLPRNSSLYAIPADLFTKNIVPNFEVQDILKLMILSREWKTWAECSPSLWFYVHFIKFHAEATEKCMVNLLMKTRSIIQAVSFRGCSDCTDKVLGTFTMGPFPHLHRIDLENVFNVHTSSVEKMLHASGASLTDLALVNCGVLSNRAVKTVCRQCPLLRSFSLAGTRLSDSAINDIARRLKCLKKIVLIRAVSVTWMAIRNLLEKLPLEALHLIACMGVFSRAFEIRTVPQQQQIPTAEPERSPPELMNADGISPPQASTNPLQHSLQVLELDLTSADPEVFSFLGRYFSNLREFSLRPLKASYLSDENCHHFLSQFSELKRLKIKSADNWKN